MVFAFKLIFVLGSIAWFTMVTLSLAFVTGSGWPVFIAWAIMAFGPILTAGAVGSLLGRFLRPQQHHQKIAPTGVGTIGAS